MRSLIYTLNEGFLNDVKKSLNEILIDFKGMGIDQFGFAIVDPDYVKLHPKTIKILKKFKNVVVVVSEARTLKLKFILTLIKELKGKGAL